VTNQWPGGFQGSVKVTNTGAALSSWTIGWTFTGGQQISQLWNGTVTQSGSVVTATNMSWNGALATNATVELGFLASWTGSNPVPTAITLNGRACTLG
jgi:endo-1,4-beta-xylanase